jgi:hypothetical protein
MPSYRFFKLKDVEEAEVYWVGNFWKTNAGQWKVNVYLFDGEKVIQDYLPIGAMPFLAVGAKVVDGYLRGSSASEDLMSLRINDFSNGWLTAFAQMPKSLCSFYGNNYLANEKVYGFSYKNKTYFIPQTEIIRSILTPNSTLANCITTPNGISFLIDNYSYKGDELNVELSEEYPRKLLTHGNVIHLMTLFTDEKLRLLWNSVYRHSLSKTKSMLDLVPLKRLNLSFKYKEFMNFVFVTEIREIRELRPTFNSITYSHPNEVEYSGESEAKERRVPKGKGDKRELDHTTSPGMDNNRDISWHDSIFVKMSFRGVKAEHKKKQSDKLKRKMKDVEADADKQKYTINDYVGSGRGVPIELQTLSALPEDADTSGLEKFMQAMTYMERNLNAKVHHVIVKPLKGDSAFIKVGNQIRNIAMVFVENAVIVEFGRPDDYPISTLILYRYDAGRIREDLVKVVSHAIDKNGWDTAYLDGFNSFSYRFGKHSRSDTPEKWAIRLWNKTL